MMLDHLERMSASAADLSRRTIQVYLCVLNSDKIGIAAEILSPYFDS
jgi:hypothetical protein